MNSSFSSRTEDVSGRAVARDVDKDSESVSTALSNEANKEQDRESLRMASEFRRLLADAETSLVNRGLLGNPQIVGDTADEQTTRVKSDAAKIEKPSRTNNAEPKERPGVQNRETLEKTADELYGAIHKGIYLHASTRSDKVSRLIESLSGEDLKALEAVYNEKYGTKHKPDALKTDLKENFTELRFRRAEATLNREIGRTNDAGALMAALAYTNENPEKGSSQLRAVFSTINSKDIEKLSADFQKNYGKSYQEAIAENKNISQSTRDVLSILEKGVDRRTSNDILKLASIGLESGDKRLFTESLRGDSKEAADARKLILSNDSLKEKIVDKFPSSEARCSLSRRSEQPFEKNVDEAVLDYLKDGRIALATITKNNTDDFTGMLDNPENVDLAVRIATDREKTGYRLGQSLTESKTQPKNEEEKQALEFYTKLKKAFVEGGGERKATMWEDQLLNGRESILTDMAKTHDWSGHSTRELMRRVEQLSKEDWALLKSPEGKEFRQQIDKSLKLYTSDEERQRISSILDKKAAASTYEESLKVQRGLEDTIKDSKKTLLGIGTGYDAAAIIRRLEILSPEEARKYKDDSRYRKQINELIDDNFSDAEKASAQRILKQVEGTGQPAKLDQADKVLQSKFNAEKPEQTIKLAEEMLKDPQVRVRFNQPESELNQEDRALKRVVVGAMEILLASSGISGAVAAIAAERMTKAFFEQGKLSIDVKVQLGFKRKDVIAEIASAPTKERESAMSLLSSDERKVAESIASNPEKVPSLADRIRAYTLGLGGEYSDFKDALKELNYDARRSLKSEYTKKYGVNLENDFLGKVDEKDRAAYKDLLTPARTDARQRFYENHADMLRSDSGWSADGSKLTLERATILYSTALEEYQKVYKTLPPEKQEALDKYFGESLKQFKDSKERLAEVMVDAVITASALAAAPFTAGTSLALVASIAAGVGATARVATMAAIQGADFEATPENMSKQLLSGATNAALSFVPFGAATRGKTLLRIAGENSAMGAVSNVTSDLVIAPFNKDEVNWDSLMQSAFMGAAMGATIPVGLKGLGKVVNLTKKPDGLHIDPQNIKEPVELRNSKTGFVLTLEPGKGESLRLSKEWQLHESETRPLKDPLSRSGSASDEPSKTVRLENGIVYRTDKNRLMEVILPNGGRAIEENGVWREVIPSRGDTDLKSRPDLYYRINRRGNIERLTSSTITQFLPDGSPVEHINPRVFRVTGKVSQEVVDKYRYAFLALPENIRDMFARTGNEIVIGRTLDEMEPKYIGRVQRGHPTNKGWENVLGAYLPNSKRIVLPEKYRQPGNESKPVYKTLKDEHEVLLRHEVGHAIDDAMKEFSESAEFAAAYAKDLELSISKLSASERDRLAYYLQPKENGEMGGLVAQSETFAELFAHITGKMHPAKDMSTSVIKMILDAIKRILSSGDFEEVSLIERSFPNVKKLLENKLADLNT